MIGPVVSKRPAPTDFLSYFAAWTRIEPRCRSADFARGLEARTADPAWMIARGWQPPRMPVRLRRWQFLWILLRYAIL